MDLLETLDRNSNEMVCYMAIKEARPTEYKGIRFRSKCEAMFARYLELLVQEQEFLSSHKGPLFSGSFGDMKGGFLYEPQQLSCDGWTPDFLLWRVLADANHESIPVLQYTIIEYKPSKPTQAYAEEFALRCDAILSMLVERGWKEFPYYTSCEIFFGSAFTKNRGRVVTHGLALDWDIYAGLDWLANFEDEVKATRYDLCVTSSM